MAEARTQSVRDPEWEGPVEQDVEVRPPVMAKAKRYKITSIWLTRSPTKQYVVQANVYDASGTLTGSVEARAKNGTLDQILSDKGPADEDYHDQSERLGAALLKAKGKMAADAVMV